MSEVLLKYTAKQIDDAVTKVNGMSDVAEITETDKGKILAVKSDGTGTEWVEKPVGGSGSVDLSQYQLKVDNNIIGIEKNIVNAINSNTNKINSFDNIFVTIKGGV